MARSARNPIVYGCNPWRLLSSRSVTQGLRLLTLRSVHDASEEWLSAISICMMCIYVHDTKSVIAVYLIK